MSDVVLEVFRALILAAIFMFLWLTGSRRPDLSGPGWHYLLGGFALLLFGSLLDITDEFESLGAFVVVGDTPIQAVLEKLVGFLGGFALIAIGLYRWIPAVAGAAELRRVNQRLMEQSHELQRAREVAETASRSKSVFLANVSHEIRTPMTSIFLAADLLRDHADDPECSEALDTIKTHGHHLLELINDILDLSKIEAGKMEVDRTSCSAVEILAGVGGMMQSLAAAKGIDLSVELRSPIPAVIHTDPRRLRQILVNLVGNGIKFTETGGVRIVAGLLENDGPPPRIQFEVIDTGIGMTAAAAAAVFEPFAQADGSTTRQHGGSGLGLSISRQLATLLGGEIAVDSAPGRGSTFCLTLPTGTPDDAPMVSRLDALGPVAAPQATPAEQAPLSCRVLLAEDDPVNSRLISAILERAGASVVVAANGREALDLVDAANDFDVILMDMHMPLVDGYEATRMMRERGHRVPIIALTANAMVEHRAACIDAGCDDFIAKPIDRAVLLHLVAEYAKSDPAERP